MGLLGTPLEWGAMPCPYAGDLPDPRIEPKSLNVFCIGRWIPLPLAPPGKPQSLFWGRGAKSQLLTLFVNQFLDNLRPVAVTCHCRGECSPFAVIKCWVIRIYRGPFLMKGSQSP